MCAQVINNRIDTIEIRRKSLVDTLKKVHPVECRTRAVGPRQRLPGDESKRAEDMAFITSMRSSIKTRVGLVTDQLSGRLHYCANAWPTNTG